MTIELFLALFFPTHSSHQESYLESQATQVVIEEEYIVPENTEYCQTVYWYPNALQLMDEAGCDFETTEREIRRAKRG